MIRLLFGFQGRINRAQYWTGVAISGFVIVLALVMLFTLGAGSINAKDPDSAAQAVGSMFLALVPVILVSAWCSLALQVKRFHDRGKTGWLAAIPCGLGGLVGFLAVTNPISLIAAAPLILLGLVVVSIWFLIELGCMPGEAGPNQFGDPPGSAGSRPASGGAHSPQPQAASSLESAEAAMARAIAQRDREPAPAAAPSMVKLTPVAAAPMGPRAGSAPSFGRRSVR